ncbi:MAG TPA: hypothetical protein VK192_06015 [Sphingomicrobium sp.]|nr:hypothetical protein [Sphingomicrobium sp.]
MRLEEMRDSIATVGQLFPVLIFRNRVIDGAKRSQVMAERGEFPTTIHCASLGDACARLWQAHPERALELAGERRLSELAELCAVSMSTIAAFKRKQFEKRERERAKDAPRPRVKARGPAKLVQVWFEPELKDAAERAAVRTSRNLSSYVREATRRLLREDLPGGPPAVRQRIAPRKLRKV